MEQDRGPASSSKLLGKANGIDVYVTTFEGNTMTVTEEEEDKNPVYVSSDVCSLLAAAMAKAQGEIEGASKGRVNPHFKNAYADLASVWDAIREPLSKNGLSIVQEPVEAPDGKVKLRTTLLHSSGQRMVSEFTMPVAQPNNPQAVGSALTYARRYTLMSVCGVAPEDDDGNSGSGNKSKPVDTKAQKEMLEAAFEDAVKDGDLEGMKSVYLKLKASSVPDSERLPLMTKFGDVIQKTINGNK